MQGKSPQTKVERMIPCVLEVAATWDEVFLKMALVRLFPLGVGRPLPLSKKTHNNLAALCSQHIGILPHPNLIHKMLIVDNQFNSRHSRILGVQLVKIPLVRGA